MTIETARDLEGLVAVGQVVRSTIAAMEAAVHPGVTTAELDLVAQQFLAHAGARSAPMLEVGYPRATCISVNEEAAHSLPGSRRIAPGDLVTLDVAAELGGYYADAAVTVAVPPVQRAHQRLCACAEAALEAAIQAARSGRALREIGRAAEVVARPTAASAPSEGADSVGGSDTTPAGSCPHPEVGRQEKLGAEGCGQVEAGRRRRVGR